MERPKFKWCREVTEQVRFKPDRDKIWDELMAHIEDRCEELKESGIAEEEAQAKAVAAMGDPVEVGKQLDKVHSPWLGWLWIVSKVILILCLIILVWELCINSPLSMFNYDDSQFWESESSEYVTVFDLTPSCEDESDGYTFTVPRAQLTHTEEHYPAENWHVEERTALRMVIQATRLLPTAEECRAFRDFYAVDDLGNRYESDGDMVYYDKSLVGNCRMKTPWTTMYHCWISELDPDAQWVELRYDRDGRDVCLRIYLTGGEQL